MPIASDSSSVISAPSGSHACASVMAAIQPAVPPPTIRMRPGFSRAVSISNFLARLTSRVQLCRCEGGAVTHVRGDDLASRIPALGLALLAGGAKRAEHDDLLPGFHGDSDWRAEISLQFQPPRDGYHRRDPCLTSEDVGKSHRWGIKCHSRTLAPLPGIVATQYKNCRKIR